MSSSPKSDLSSFPLTHLAAEINEAFRAVDNSRVRAGLLLIEARAYVEASRQQWTAWCAININRSMRDIQKCMRLARADNPAAAAEAERTKARVGMAQTRAAQMEAANVSRLGSDDDGVDEFDLSSVKARIGKHSIDLSALSPDVQAQIAQQLGVTASEDGDPDAKSAEGEKRYAWSKPGGNADQDGRSDDATASTEWWTPPEIFEAMEVEFDIDPASPGADVVPWVPAARHVTKPEDGLTADWGDAFAWLNGPFGERNNVNAWVDKFLAHGNGVMLVPDWTSAKWWQRLCSVADALLFVSPKIQFLPRREGRVNILGSVLVAVGTRGVRALRNAARNGRGLLAYPHHEPKGVLQFWPVWPMHRKYGAMTAEAVPLEPVGARESPTITPVAIEGGADGNSEPPRCDAATKSDLSRPVAAKLVKAKHMATLARPQPKPMQTSVPDCERGSHTVIRPAECPLRRSIGCQSRKVCGRKDECMEAQRRAAPAAA